MHCDKGGIGMGHERYSPRPVSTVEGMSFHTVEEAWMWSVQATIARHEGARVVAGLGNTVRPCEPVDVMRVVSRLNRDGVLSDRHVSVLVRYGRRRSAPDARRRQEFHDARLWDDALDKVTGPLRERGIVI